MNNTFTNKLQNMVEEFHVKFGHPHNESPKALELGRITDRTTWTVEEFVAELLHASSSNKEEYKHAFAKVLEGLYKAYFEQLDKEFIQNDEDRIVAQADALTDGIYFAMGSAVELGVDIEPVFDIVQGANMSKLFTDENGNKFAKYREDGKVLKSPDFYQPEEFIQAEIKKQMNN
jgi:predicted HAD superfamily Cof-like phosphohydrolase